MNSTETISPSIGISNTNAPTMPYLEGGFAGVVAMIVIILLRAILTDWLRDQEMIREMLKKSESQK